MNSVEAFNSLVGYLQELKLTAKEHQAIMQLAQNLINAMNEEKKEK